MSDARGTFEHALFDQPRREHGYCTDDIARVLVVAARERDPLPAVGTLTELSLRFLTDALVTDGQCHNRMNLWGRWEDEAGVEDCWGRTIWGLGTAIARSDHGGIRQWATVQFDRACRQRSPWPRAMAFAALGTANVLAVRPGHAAARALLNDAADAICGLDGGPGWLWPEKRLSYANAVVPEAMIAAGAVLERPDLLQAGLELLEWLLERETDDGHLSVTPAGGAGPDDVGPAFDQQPIEVAAMADACARAAGVDGHQRWPHGVSMAARWFLGDNDSGTIMWDPVTKGGFDGLERCGANANEGTESTLAMLSTFQLARSFVAVPQ
ncbi:MAG TPA: hypothetical protein VNG12_11960 [Acidimicrobiales bacterium]|nr:hypothetical protein [Acidimicrobiales bacterium]